MLIFLASGCRGVPPFPGPPSADSTVTATGPLTLILWHSESGAARDELEALARDFHSAYPDLAVTPTYVGNNDDLVKQVTAAIALGRVPDLVLASRRELAQFIRQSGVLQLDAFSQDPSTGLSQDDYSDIFPGLVDEGKFGEFDRQTFAFPFGLDAMVLLYNPELLKAAAFDKPPQNWNQFVDMASRVTKDQQFGWAMGIDANVFSAMLVSQGSAELDLPERRTLFAERGGVAAMTLASQLMKSGAAHARTDHSGALQDFVEGRAAFYFDWISELNEAKQAQSKAQTTFDIGLANVPQADPADPYMLVRGNDLAILKIAPERARQAWFLIRWLTASRQTARWAHATGSVPLRASALPFLVEDSANIIRIRQIQDSFGAKVPHFVSLPAGRQVAQIEELMTQAWSQIALSKADVAGTLTAASVTANQLLAGSR